MSTQQNQLRELRRFLGEKMGVRKNKVTFFRTPFHNKILKKYIYETMYCAVPVPKSCAVLRTRAEVTSGLVKHLLM